LISVFYQDMPCKVHGLIRANEDGSYTIILNSRDSRERNLQAYQHELDHLLKGDFEKVDTNEIEGRAHHG